MPHFCAVHVIVQHSPGEVQLAPAALHMPITQTLVTGSHASAEQHGFAPEQGSPTKPQPIEVSTITANARSIQRSVEVVGTLMADEEATVSSEVAGPAFSSASKISGVNT